MRFEITWSPVSARFEHSILRFALASGVEREDCAHVAAKVISEVRRDVKANARKTVMTTKANGEEIEKAVKEHQLKQRASGAKLLKLSLGTKEEWYLEDCNGLTQALVRIDQGLLALETAGAGIDWMPPVGSLLEKHLLTACVAVKASMDAERARKAAMVPAQMPATNGAV